MAEGGVLSYGTHRYLIVHTWVGLKHSDTMEHTQRETERNRRREGRQDKEEEMEKDFLNQKISGDQRKKMS